MEKDIKEIGIMIRKKDLELINYHKNGNRYGGGVGIITIKKDYKYEGLWKNEHREGIEQFIL